MASAFLQEKASVHNKRSDGPEKRELKNNQQKLTENCDETISEQQAKWGEVLPNLEGLARGVYGKTCKGSEQPFINF